MLNIFYKILIGGLTSLAITTAIAATPVATVNLPFEKNKKLPEDVTPLLNKALTIVLIRLTGNPEITEQPAVSELLKTPNTLLESFNPQEEEIEICFNQNQVEQALQNANIAYWGLQKPNIMTWWLEDTITDPLLIGDSLADAAILRAAALEQGFPIVLPLADLSEQSLATQNNFITDISSLLQASKQYTANAILIVYVQSAPNKYIGQWQLWLPETQQPLAKGQIEEKTKALLANQIYNKVNTTLAKTFVTKAKHTEELEVMLTHVNFNQYAKINNMMSTFKAQLIETTGMNIRYKVTADPTQLKARLRLMNFVPEQMPTPQTKNGKTKITFSPISYK